ADALGHCAECHTPRNIFGAMIGSERYAGGADIEGNGWVPNITPGPDGIPHGRSRQKHFGPAGFRPCGTR
ncbi:MAG TPA: alkylated DNA repair protein, partial [Beijerinckiaceae bacterium]|nr:alkylated DNA repair protein [Beijerinckiaceae bacterium]